MLFGVFFSCIPYSIGLANVCRSAYAPCVEGLELSGSVHALGFCAFGAGGGVRVVVAKAGSGLVLVSNPENCPGSKIQNGKSQCLWQWDPCLH